MKKNGNGHAVYEGSDLIPLQYRPLTKGHQFYAKAIQSNIITACIGPWGCSKTWTPCALGSEMLKTDRIKKLILTRPLKTCGPDMGFFPGDYKEKSLPYMRSMLDVLGAFLTKKELDEYQKRNMLEIIPLELLEGLSFNDAMLVADEMNPAEEIQILTLLTRIGKNCKLVMIGNSNHKKFPLCQSPLNDIIEKLCGMDNFQLVCLTEEDIVRSPIVKEIILRCT